MQADRPYLVVRNTRNGGSEGIVPSPTGSTSTASTARRPTTARSSSREPACRLPAPPCGTCCAFARADTPMTMVSLPIPVPQDPAGVALSPDGTQVAVALNGSQPSLRVYSVATGALLHTWSAPPASSPRSRRRPASWQSPSWRCAGPPTASRLAFAWNAKDIRALDAADAGRQPARREQRALSIGTTDGLDATYICNAWQGWEPVEGGRGVSGGHGVISRRRARGASANGRQHGRVHGEDAAHRRLPEATLTAEGDGYTGLTAREPECPATAGPETAPTSAGRTRTPAS